jgi:hypothetical protein
VQPCVGGRGLASFGLALSTDLNLMYAKDTKVVFIVGFASNQITIVSSIPALDSLSASFLIRLRDQILKPTSYQSPTCLDPLQLFSFAYMIVTHQKPSFGIDLALFPNEFEQYLQSLHVARISWID